jgi:hypothetical protein
MHYALTIARDDSERVALKLMQMFGNWLCQTRLSWILAVMLLSLSVPALAQTVEAAADNPPDTETAADQAIAADGDGSLDDADNSIDIEKVEHGVSVEADVRTGYSGSDTDNRDGSNTEEDVLRARWRVTGTVGIFPYLRGSVRMAGLCSDVECEPNFVLTDYIPTNSGMADGDITLDKAFLHWYRLEKFDIALGRMQTKFVARGGVFAKSLDRNDSNNTNVNWVDGMHAAYQAKHGWVSHLIVQHNAPEGATEIRRGPLNFRDDDARVSYFLALENLERTQRFLQRGLDISYLPKSLLKDGTPFGPHEDYYGIVLRSANRWPERDEGVRLRVAAELGYAPETQTLAAAGLTGTGDADGLAWNVVLSLMDFKPSHSIGVNYGQVGAGWLLSPQFRQNESLTEIRYQWRRSKQLALDIRVRRRTELEQLASSDQKQNATDFFVRLTWGGTIW